MMIGVGNGICRFRHGMISAFDDAPKSVCDCREKTEKSEMIDKKTTTKTMDLGTYESLVLITVINTQVV